MGAGIEVDVVVVPGVAQVAGENAARVLRGLLLEGVENLVVRGISALGPTNRIPPPPRSG